MFVICAEAIMYLLLHNLHDCTFKLNNLHYDMAYFIYQKLKYLIQNLAKIFEDIHMINHGNIAENKTTLFTTVLAGKVPNIEDTQI